MLTSQLLRYEQDKKKNPGTLNLDTTIPGYYPVELSLPPFTYQVTVHVQDTTPPSAAAQPVTLYQGEECGPEDFVGSIEDASNVTVSFQVQPDFAALGEQQVRLLLTDAAGNKAELTSTLTVEEPLPFDEEAPAVGIEDIYVAVGGNVPYRKVMRIYDNVDTEEQLTIEVDRSAVNLNEVGDYPYTVTVTDRNGNATTAGATVHVVEDDSNVVDIEEVNALADAVLEEILTDGMTPKEKLRAIYDWIQDSMHYEGNSQEEDAVLAAYTGFTDHTGNCFQYTAQATFLLTRAGIDNMVITKVVPEGRTDISTHCWNIVNIGEGWYHYDCTPRRNRRDFFYITDSKLKWHGIRA